MKITKNQLKELIRQSIKELDFKDMEAFKKYKTKHKMKPTTKVTVGDQPLSTAIFVKLYVPYATKPNMKPVYNVFIKLPESTQG